MKINEGRVKQSAKNMISGFLYQTVTLILSFISRTVFINTLGTEYLGLNGIFTDVLSLLPWLILALERLWLIASISRWQSMMRTGLQR